MATSFMKIGVALPIRNHSFRDPLVYYGEVCNTISTGDTSITIRNTNVDNLEWIVGSGNKIRLESSSHTLNIGASEEVEISSIAEASDTYTLTLADTITYYYKPTDDVSGLSKHFPDGWELTPDGNTITSYPLCRLLDPDTTSSYETHLAADDFYSFKMRVVKSSTSTVLLRQTLDTTLLLPLTYYRVGGIYKVKWGSGIALSSVNSGVYQVTPVANKFVNYEIINSSGSTPSTWTVFNSGANKTIYNPSGCIIEFSIFNNVGTGDCLLYMDCFYVEHAKNTDGDTDAVYTFTEYPVFKSESWVYEEFDQKLEQKDGTLKFFNTTGRVANKWMYSCRFEQVSETFYKNLETLLHWQRQGSYLILHTAETVSNFLPPILMGKMEIRDVKQSVFDLERKDFTFIFEEK